MLDFSNSNPYFGNGVNFFILDEAGQINPEDWDEEVGNSYNMTHEEFIDYTNLLVDNLGEDFLIDLIDNINETLDSEEYFIVSSDHKNYEIFEGTKVGLICYLFENYSEVMYSEEGEINVFTKPPLTAVVHQNTGGLVTLEEYYDVE